jgi:hypothetical protein
MTTENDALAEFGQEERKQKMHAKAQKAERGTVRNEQPKIERNRAKLWEWVLRHGASRAVVHERKVFPEKDLGDGCPRLVRARVRTRTSGKRCSNTSEVVVMQRVVATVFLQVGLLCPAPVLDKTAISGVSWQGEA